MKKRFFSIFLCILTLLTLLSTFTLASSAESIEVETSIYGKLYSIDNEEFYAQRSGNPVLNIYPIYANAYVDIGYAIKLAEGIKPFYTYKLSFKVNSVDSGGTNGAIFEDMVYNNIYVFKDTQWASFIEDPFFNSSSLNEIASNINVSFVYSDVGVGIKSGEATVIFSCNKETDNNILAPFVYAHNTEDDAVCIASIVNIEVYKDYDQQVYQDLVYKQQEAIKNEIEQGFSQTNDSLGEIKDALTGDGEYTPPDPQFQQGVDNLGDKEAEIMENITEPIKLPNGTTVQIDQNTLNTLKVYYNTAYNAPTYEETMGDQIEKIFDVFMPYVGTVIYLSLFLGLAIAFLTGRRLI